MSCFRRFLLLGLLLAPLMAFPMAQVVSAANPLLVADYSFEVRNNSVNFTDLSKGYGIVKWSWAFGDGTSSLEQNPLHVYKEKGNYSVMLTVTDSNGMIATHLGLVHVINVPETNVNLYYLAIALLVVGIIAIPVARNPAGRVAGTVLVILGLIILTGVAI